jgi:hypothetical protein
MVVASCRHKVRGTGDDERTCKKIDRTGEEGKKEGARVGP